MSSVSGIERSLKHIVIENCWSYLHDNFHKLTETNKIKVSMALCTKSIPQEVTGNLNHVVQMPTIQIDGKPLEFNIGQQGEQK